MNEFQPDQSYDLSYDDNWFLTYHKGPKVKIPCFYSKEGDLY